MEESRTLDTESEESIARGEHRFVILWAAGLILLYAAGGYFGVTLLLGYTAEADKAREALIEASTAVLEPALSPGAKPATVQVSINMNRFGEFALKESAWTADFDIAFRWTGDGVN